jgi:S1-C subfamily serine protease
MPTSAAQAASSKALQRSVVKVLTVSDSPDYDQPWQTQGTVSASGSGSIVSTAHGLRVLTNAHVVENQVFVEVRRYGKSRKFVAEVEGVGHVCDLALLTIDDEAFFEGVTPIELGGLPSLGDSVSVLGYPIGGDRLSVTKGIVSRIEMFPYAQSQRSLLAVQVDAAINSGNSGGPVIRDGKIAGVAFQSLEEGEAINYMIASPVVRHFLQDMEDGTFDGFPDLGVTTQHLESLALRRSLKLPESQHGGVLVTNVTFEGSAWQVLKRGDVLLTIDGTKVASDASVRFRKGERIDFSHRVSSLHVGDVLPLQIWRDGALLDVEVKLKPPQYLVPEDRFDVKPSYFIYGGLLFVPLTRDYLKTWGSDWHQSAPHRLLALYEGSVRSRGRKEVVVLQKVLADRVNQGYHGFESQIVERVQGKRVSCLADLVKCVESSTDPFVHFDLASRKQIVLDDSLVEKRNKSIMRRFGVPADRSDDLR